MKRILTACVLILALSFSFTVPAAAVTDKAHPQAHSAAPCTRAASGS